MGLLIAMGEQRREGTILNGRIVTRDGTPAPICLVKATVAGFGFPEMAIYSDGQGKFFWPFFVPSGVVHVTAIGRDNRSFRAEGNADVATSSETIFLEINEL